MPHERRSYRRRVAPEGLVSFGVRIGETNLRIAAPEKTVSGTVLSRKSCQARLSLAQGLAREARAELHRWRKKTPAFFEAMEPHEVPDDAPEIVRAMARAGELAGVGPMAAVAGAIAERVGRGLMARASDLPPAGEVIVENGGDIFMVTRKTRHVAIFAGESQLSMKLAVEIAPEDTPCGVCTSSATVGPSMSFGAADAAVVLAPDAALADAVATALGNRVRSRGDLEPALEWVLSVEGVRGALVVLGETFAAQGRIKVAPGTDAVR